MMQKQSPIITRSDEETIEAGVRFSRTLKRGDVVACFGDLGAGKTRFIKGICKGLGVREHVASPTFTIVNEYNVGELTIYHFDFYRMNSIDELREIGFGEYLESGGIVLIEWADRVRNILPSPRYDVSMTLGESQETRRIEVEQISEVTA